MRTKGFPADNGGKVEFGFAVNGRLDSAFEVDGPSLVEPAENNVRTG